MRPGLIMHEVTAENLAFAAQLGVTDLVVSGEGVAGETGFDLQKMRDVRSRVEAAGLRVAALHNVPSRWYDKIRYAMPGRERQMEELKRSIADVGKAGIPMVGYQFHAVRVFRTSRGTRGRGGALVSSYDHSRMEHASLEGPREIGEDELWESLSHFVKQIIPIAEESGVKLALHPDDPPISPIAGAACPIRSVEAFQRVLDLAPSPSNGVLFCQGCFAEMGTDVYESRGHFGKQNKIFYVHFRNVKGVVPRFAEAFIDDGDIDMVRAIRAYRDAGYDGILVPDHLPRMPGDSLYQHRSRAFAVGFIKALIAAVSGA